MIEAIIFSIFLVMSFMGITIYNTKEIPESISAMVWGLKGDLKWLWSIWLLAVSILTFVPAIEILDTNGLGIIGFLSMVCISFVAILPLFDREHVMWHNIFAIIGGVLSQVSVALINPWWLLMWLITPIVFIKPLRSKYVMILEIICYVSQIGADIL